MYLLNKIKYITIVYMTTNSNYNFLFHLSHSGWTTDNEPLNFPVIWFVYYFSVSNQISGKLTI